MNLAPDQIAAVVLAGGFGTRIRHLLTDLPKPMAPVNGRPFIEWVVRFLARQGIHEIVLSTGFLAEKVKAHFDQQPVQAVQVRCVQENRPLGTAGGFLNAARESQLKPRAWIVLNGDSLALTNLSVLWNSMTACKAIAGVLSVPMVDASRYGTVERDTSDELVGFHEKQPGPGTINAGIYCFQSAALELFSRSSPLSFENEVFPELITQNQRVKVCVTEASFLDIGTPESLPLADVFVREHFQWF